MLYACVVGVCAVRPRVLAHGSSQQARSFFPPFLLHGLEAGYVKRAVWWRARELTGLGTDRAEVAPETPLVAFCTGRFQGLAKSFTLPDGTSMLVDDLCGYTKEELMAFVKSDGGPYGLVPAWLEKHGLWRYLRGYVASIDASSTLETASRQMGALSLDSAPDLHGPAAVPATAPRALVYALFLFQAH